MNPLRIAMSGNNYPPEFLGGTERVMQALAREVRAAGDQVLVLAGSEVATEPTRDEVDGIPVFRLPLQAGETYGLNIERPRLREAMREILVAEAIDVLHVHHWSHLSDGQVRLAHELGIAVIVTLHDMWTSCPRFFRLPPAGIECPEGAGRDACIRCVNLDLNESEPWVAERLAQRDRDLTAELRLAAAIFAPSQDCADACLTHRDWGDQPPTIEVLPHGLLDERPVAPRGPLGLPLRVGTFGNLNREKGVLVLVEAMQGIRAELHLYGKGTPEFQIEVEARAAALDVRLVWHGAYLDTDPHPASQLDLAVFPSLCRETYGLVVDEALHQGTPVIVSAIGALPERCNNGGIAVRPGSVEDLAGAIRGLVEERDAYHMLRAMIPTDFPTIVDTVATYRHHYAKAWAGNNIQGSP